MGKSDNQHLTVLVRPRQTRVAFLIDPATASLDLLDALFSWSTSVWGGRLFPIVPVVEGVISAGYWSLLRTVDPDLIYSYTALPQDVVDKLLNDINPLTMQRHSDHLLRGDHPSYVPWNLNQLVRVRRLLPYATEVRWFRKPALVTYRTKTGKADPLIARNFGILRGDILGEPIPEGITQFSFDDSENFATLLEKLSDQRGGLVYPFTASAARSIVRSGMDAYETTYTIFVGDDPGSLVTFWNHIFTLGAAVRDVWKAFCLPTKTLQDAPTIEALTKFFRRYAGRNGDHPPYLHWVSANLNDNELKELAAPFQGKKLDAFFRYTQISPWFFPELPQREKHSFGLSGGAWGEPKNFGATAHQVPSSGGLVNAPGLPFESNPDEQWMQDVRIQYLADYPYYSNEELQYQLPRKSEIAQLFCALPGRVDSDGGLSFLATKSAPLFVTVPEDRTLILASIGLGRRTGYDGNLNRTELPRVYQDHGPSDKARYCRGVIDLFGGLQSAQQTFENHFWKNVFYYLAGLGKHQAGSDATMIYQRIAKHPERWTIDAALTREEEISRIEKEVIKLAQHVRVRENETTLFYLEQKLVEERAEFRRRHPNNHQFDAVDPNSESAQVRSDLKRALQGFADSKIFRQGTNTRCRHCGSRIWQEISSLKQEFKCLGCGSIVNTAVETTWYYRLNTLVRSAIVEHGTVALIGALAKAREEAKHSFLYSPGLELYENYDDKNPAAEIDAICLVDGKLWVGEVKTNAAEFKPREIEKLVGEAQKMRADKTFVFALEGDQEALHRRCEDLSKNGPLTIIRLRPGSWGRFPSFHI